VLEGIDELNRERNLDLAARAAVNTGEAVVAVSGGEGEALATGDVVNAASRLQEGAPVGRLLAGAETYRATRHAIGYEVAAPIRATGKERDIKVWLAVEPTLPPAERPASARLVGRARELDLMRSVWTGCLDERRPHLVTVMGPPESSGILDSDSHPSRGRSSARPSPPSSPRTSSDG
jgi:hypothetical protein